MIDRQINAQETNKCKKDRKTDRKKDRNVVRQRDRKNKDRVTDRQKDGKTETDLIIKTFQKCCFFLKTKQKKKLFRLLKKIFNSYLIG